MVAGRQSPNPEEQDPKQGTEATGSGSVDKEEQFAKATGEEKKASENVMEKLPSNPDRKARV